MTFADQLPALVGVALGAVTSYLATSFGDQARWRRTQSVRWDERRLAVYAEYGNAVKEMVIIAERIAAGRGFTPFPQSLELDDESLHLLAAAEARRNSLIETVRLLADAATMNSIRAMNSQAWHLEALARGELEGSREAWEKGYDAYMAARDSFVESARTSLGVPGSVTPKTPLSRPWDSPR